MKWRVYFDNHDPIEIIMPTEIDVWEHFGRTHVLYVEGVD